MSNQYLSFLEEQDTLYYMAKQISQCLEKIENYKDNIVLLIGKTGSGKSTLFNLLLNGKYLYRKDIDAVELDCKDPKFSEVKQGTSSVTKFPNLYFDDDSKHLLIDFPGFDDTNGEDFLTEAIVNKIITNFKVKLFYIVENYSNSLPNRGTDLQNHLKEIFREETSNQIHDSIYFVFNKYNDNNKDLLKNTIDKEFKKFNWNSKYLIIDKVKNDEGTERFNYLNDQLWKAIKTTPSQKINSMFNFKNPYQLIDFLEKGDEYFFENVLNYIAQSLTDTLFYTQLSAIIRWVEQMKNDFFSKKISDLSQQSFNDYQNIILEDLKKN